MARVEKAIKTLVEVFHHYAEPEGKKRMLNKEELKKMLDTEIQCSTFKEKIKADDIDEALKTMDKNNDGNIRFGEFYRGVGIMARAYYREEYGKKGKEDGQKA